MLRQMKCWVCAAVLFSVLGCVDTAMAAGSQLVARVITAKSLAQTRIGVDPNRAMVVYLPPGYDRSAQRYPVIYYLPNAADSFRADFDKHEAQALFDRAIAVGSIGDFILVTTDLTTPIGCSWYVNSPVTGNWEDFVVDELVPYVDANFRTLANRDSRGILGDRMGGYGAIRLGMRHPNVFGSVYALHPVGTGSGIQTMHSRPDWNRLAHAQSIDELRGDPFSNIFLSIYQAHLPNPSRPPLYIEFPAHREGAQLVTDSVLTARLRDNFLLESQIPRYADNLKSLRGFKFDWGRSDSNQDHVYSNQAFTHKLDEFGILHEAEEYRGGFGDRLWGEEGRVYSDVLPFFQRHLAFDARARGPRGNTT
jgi:S-formylglutathione hydrolase FrmB